MYNYLFDLEAAELHQRDLQREAAHERLVNEALRRRREAHADTIITRLLHAIKADWRPRPDDSRLN